VIFKTLFPKWVGERYELPVADWLNEESYTLRLKVRDYDTFSSDDDLGFCNIDLRPMRGGITQSVWQDLQGVETGSLRVQITIKDDVGLWGGCLSPLPPLCSLPTLSPWHPGTLAPSTFHLPPSTLHTVILSYSQNEPSTPKTSPPPPKPALHPQSQPSTPKTSPPP